MKHEAWEAEKQRAHELIMMERHMQMQMQFGKPGHPQAPMHVGHVGAAPFAPHFGAPASIDPKLFN